MSVGNRRVCSGLGLGVFAALVVATSASGATKLLRYYGGRVVSNPQVLVVAWGSGVDSSIQAEMAGFYTAILNSPYLDWVSEYSSVGTTPVDGQPGSNQRIGRGRYLGSYSITPSTTATTISNDTVKAELAAQIAAGHLPAPVTDAAGNVNTVYMINFPPGITITISGAASCVQFCSIQDTMTIGGKSVGIGVIPDQGPTSNCASGCGTDADYVKNAIGVHAYELLDIVTGPEDGLAASVARPIGWYDPSNGRISDLCNSSSQHALVAGYTVSKGWSNRLATCIATADLTLCDGSTTYCRQCTTPDAGQAADCTGAKPVCETNATTLNIGLCRACAADAECTGNAAGPHCLASGSCGAAVVADAGTGGGGSGSSGCSSTGGAPMVFPAVLALAGLAIRRRRVTA